MESIIPIFNMVLIDKFDEASPHSSYNEFWEYVLEQKEIKTIESYTQVVLNNLKDERSIQLLTFLSEIALNSPNIIIQLYLYKTLRQMVHEDPELFESRLDFQASPLVEALELLESSIKFKLMETRDNIDSTG